MSEYTSKKLKESRLKALLPLNKVAEIMGFSKRKLIMIESCETSVSTDEILLFSKIYNVDVRELLIEEHDNPDSTESIAKEYGEFAKTFNLLTDKEKSDIHLILKKWVEGRLL